MGSQYFSALHVYTLYDILSTSHPDNAMSIFDIWQASGGSGDYVWTINDTSVADLGPKAGSTAPIRTKNVIGTSLVTVTDVRNSLHFDTSQVKFDMLQVALE